MDINDFRAQILIVLVTVAVLWVLFKAMKWIRRLVFIFLVFLGLSFAFPAIREWIFGLF